MTIGQRIAQKRKEQDFSQESLGNRLGVSRQSIYKWEADAALPEIEKLVALSRLFGVSVGWLLGVEEAVPAETVSKNGGELTEAQLRMVEEIVGRYLAVQPKPMSPKRRLVFKISIAAAALCLIFALWSLFQRLDRMDQQYDSLQSSVNNVTSSVNSQIGGISDRVEAVLKAQNHLTADYSTELFRVNYGKNQALFHAQAVPKTFQEGMEVRFQVTNGSGGSTVPGERDLRGAYTATLAEELTDHIEISVLFTYPDGTTQTQLLDTYEDLYSGSLPQVDVTDDNLCSDALADSFLFTIPASNDFPVRYIGVIRKEPGGAAAIRELRVGLFKNQALVAWAEPCDRPDSFLGNYLEDCWEFYALPDLRERLAPGDTLCFAAVITDEYDRTLLCPGVPVTMDETGDTLIYPSSFIMRTITPDGWEFA